MTITERLIGDVTILELKGKITLGEGDETLNARIRRVLGSGRRRVALNLAEVPYIDSSGNGEMVRAYTLLARAGGKLVLLNPSKRIYDLLSITKLLTVYEVYDSEPDALASFGTVNRIGVCPVCRLRAAFGQSPHSIQRCANCTSAFTVSREPVAWSVDHISIPTYGEEEVVLTRGQPDLILVSGRLDLFSAEAVEQAWRAVPRPRKVRIELGAQCVLVTVRGAHGLSGLCEPESDGGRSVVCCADLPAHVDTPVPVEPPFYRDRAAATAALRMSADFQLQPIVVEANDRWRR